MICLQFHCTTDLIFSFIVVGDYKLGIVQWPAWDRSYQFQYKSEKQKLLPDYDFDNLETIAYSILCEKGKLIKNNNLAFQLHI